MVDRWAPKPVLEERDEPSVVRARRRHTALYAAFFWLGLFAGFVAFEAITPVSVRAAIRALYVSQEWSFAWVLFACGIVMAFVGAAFATAYERIHGRREP